MTSIATPKAARTADGSLLALLTAAFYLLFTLLPGSSTLVLAWPWVFLWQVSLMLPVLWLLWQVALKPLSQIALGNRLDCIVGLLLLGLGVSAATATFRAQALWYTWPALGGLAALYGLNSWLTTRQRQRQLLQFQGGLAIAFIVLSLTLWTTQIYLPELARLSGLQQYGVELGFSFQFTSLRNWQPIGHQNYVAGYLVLVLPLLLGLAWVSAGWPRSLWLLGAGLGLINLYTTSSRGGWLAMAGLGLVSLAVALLLSTLPRWLLAAVGGLGLAAMGLAIATNDRLSQLFQALLQGNVGGSELAYRLITNAVGWQMGLARPLTGQGLGSVPLVYQQFRPIWAGREAELQYQLHSTPAQLWGELGLWGLWVPLLLAGWLLVMTFRWRQRRALAALPEQPTLPDPLVWSLLGGLFAYSLISLTDYQLDNLCISGVLIVYLAALARSWHPSTPCEAQRPRQINRWLVGLGIGLSLAMTAWLVPIHRAWSLSSAGFATLQRGDLDGFVQRLEQAHRLAPWEPYYAHQLGWILGDLSYQSPEPQQSAALRASAITWFETANRLSPYQEFGRSNLGWLQIGANQPPPAAAAFVQASQLVPAKPGVFFGLGFSRLLAGDTNRAVGTLALELVRNPMLITSPLWQAGQFAGIYSDVLNQLETFTSSLLNDAPAGAPAALYLHQIRGGLRWWQDDLAGATQDWQASGSAVGLALLALAQEQPVDLTGLSPNSAPALAIQAWLSPSPEQRRSLLEQAWLAQPEDVPQLDESLPPEDLIAQLAASMAQSTSFDDWLKRNAPIWKPRSQRLGFGIISRHIDGPQPSDYLPRVENVPMVKFFAAVFPEVSFMPELDQLLQPERDRLTQ